MTTPSEARRLADQLVDRASELRDRVDAADGGELTAAVARATQSLGDLAEVLGLDPAAVAGLAAEAGDPAVVLRDGPIPLPPLEITIPVLGVDACKAGWVGAILEPGAPRPRIAVAATIAGLVETVRQSLGIQVVGIDIPIGLPDDTTRHADALARKALRGKASSIFMTLTRAAYAAESRAEADTANRSLSGQGVGAQAFALRTQDRRGRRLGAQSPDRDGPRGPPRAVLRDDGRRTAALGQEDGRRSSRAPGGPSRSRPRLAIGPDRSRVCRRRRPRRVCGRVDGGASGSRAGPPAPGPARGLLRRHTCGDLGLSPTGSPGGARRSEHHDPYGDPRARGAPQGDDHDRRAQGLTLTQGQGCTLIP